jgi:hypothetical protein
MQRKLQTKSVQRMPATLATGAERILKLESVARGQSAPGEVLRWRSRIRPLAPRVSGGLQAVDFQAKRKIHGCAWEAKLHRAMRTNNIVFCN